jgi:hypothetical protein
MEDDSPTRCVVPDFGGESSLEPNMQVFAVLIVATLLAIGATPGTAFAQKAAVPKQSDTVAIASDKVKEMLALMDTDKSGKISKQKWMKFMEAEFDRLDPKKIGEVDPKELLPQAPMRYARSADVGK